MGEELEGGETATDRPQAADEIRLETDSDEGLATPRTDAEPVEPAVREGSDAAHLKHDGHLEHNRVGEKIGETTPEPDVTTENNNDAEDDGA